MSNTLLWLQSNKPNIPDLGLTSPKLAMLDEFKLPVNGQDLSWAIDNYRNYYTKGKIHLHSWTNRNKPSWIN